MKKVFVDLEDLIDFFYKEGEDAYNSLVASNNIVSNGVFFYLKFPKEFLK